MIKYIEIDKSEFELWKEDKEAYWKKKREEKYDETIIKFLDGK